MTKISTTNSRYEIPRTLEGKTALVTGGGRGIGRAIANKLASLGADVAICGRDMEAIQRTQGELEEKGVKAFSLQCDVTKPREVEEMAADAEEALGGISILVNNAGIGMFGLVHEKSVEEWDLAMDSNLKSVFLVSKAVIPGMIQRGGGDIINISSLAGKNVFGGGGLYCASKWGLQGLTGCMAEELREHGIRVTSVCPGSVGTEFAGRGPKDPNLVLRPEDVAHAVGMVALQGAQSFISTVEIRPLRRP